jgi:hypothetical protein
MILGSGTIRTDGPSPVEAGLQLRLTPYWYLVILSFQLQSFRNSMCAYLALGISVAHRWKSPSSFASPTASIGIRLRYDVLFRPLLPENANLLDDVKAKVLDAFGNAR